MRMLVCEVLVIGLWVKAEEPNAIGGDGVNRRGLNVLISVATKVVRTEGVDGNEENVGTLGGRRKNEKRRHEQ